MSSRTVFTVLEQAAVQYGEAPALYQPLTQGKEQEHRVYSWAEYRRAAAEIAVGLRQLGIGKGDVVGLHSETRAEFYLGDLGVMANGSVAAALYCSYPVNARVQTLRACDARAVFVEDPKSLRSLQTADGPPLPVRWILLTSEMDGVLTLEQLREQGRRAMEADPGLFARISSEVNSADPAILYLTSGATGDPKMVMVSHAALVANVDMGPSVLNLGPSDATVAFLPSAHIAQRVVVELLPIRYGMPVWFVESLAKLPQALRTVKPTLLLAPPRFWERVYTSACIEINKRPPLVRKLFYGSLDVGLELIRLRREGKSQPLWMRVTLRLADRLLFQKVRARFGGRLRVPVSGAAPLGKDLALFYEVIGMPLFEGYGLTEGGVATLNPIDRPKAGSIGKALPGVEVRLAEDGELLLRSPCLLSGYYKDPEGTAELLRGGWLHTGDIAEIDDEGYIYITSRKKEVIISSSGKNVYPARIEALFKMEPLVNTVVLVGDRLPYVSALFTINPVAAEALKGMSNCGDRSPTGIATAGPVLAELRNAVARVNKQLAPFEQIRKFGILNRELSIERGELTATSKIRRGVVLENFRDRITELYAGKEESH